MAGSAARLQVEICSTFVRNLGGGRLLTGRCIELTGSVDTALAGRV